MHPFEAALFEGQPILGDDRELGDAAAQYLSHAHLINSVIDIYLGMASGPGSIGASYSTNARIAVVAACSELPPTLDNLEQQLENSLNLPPT